MDKKYFSRMGDGSIVYMTKEEIQADIAEGIADAAKRGKIQPLSAEDAERIYEIITMPGTVVGVEHGRQVVSTSDDGSFCKVKDSPIDRMTQMIIYERFLGADSVDMGQTDYNFKTAKAVVVEEVTLGKSMLNYLVMPVLYGGMPNLGYYTKPDGPVENWAELLPAGRVEEALKAQEDAVDYAVHDIVYVAKVMREAGIDGINIDTAGAAGDADFLAALKAAKTISTNWPELGIEMGMAGEFVLGMHGKLEYEGTRLAGLYPHKQVKLAEAAGVSIFGPVVNTNTNKSLAWNLARTCTFIKACSDVATIPIHPNVGMGVCGVPMTEVLPVDAVTRVGKALIEICNVDGLQIGEGENFGSVVQNVSNCMGGIHSAGDMVLRMELNHKMRIGEAKKYVAGKLGITIEELCDSTFMADIRTDLGLGVQQPKIDDAIGVEAKNKISQVLDIKINSVEWMKKRSGLK